MNSKTQIYSLGRVAIERLKEDGGNGRIKKILIVQTAFIGDVILSTPMADALRSMFSEGEIDYIVIPAAVGLLETNPNIRRVIAYDKRGQQRRLRDFLKLAGELRRQNYDFAVVPHRSLRSALLVWLARIPHRIGFDRSAGSFLLTQIVPYLEKHEVDRNLDLLRSFGDIPENVKPKIFWSDQDREDVAELTLRAPQDRDWIAIAPGSVWATKRWLPERFIELAKELIDKLNAFVFLIGGRDDYELCSEIESSIGEHCINTAGALSLRQSTALLSRCQLLISNDSAPAHLGVASGCKVLTIFGPTVPRFGFYPMGDYDQIVETKLSCRPCSSHGSHTCPIGTHACMTEIQVSGVLKKTQSMLLDETESLARKSF